MQCEEAKEHEIATYKAAIGAHEAAEIGSGRAREGRRRGTRARERARRWD